MESPKITEKLPKLDFLRAVSAASVVLYHAGVPGVPVSYGVLGFFVISGFLITYLLLRENDRTGHISLKNFYIRRSLRIFPAFYAYWLLVVVNSIYKGRIHMWWPQIVCSFFYVNNYYQGLHHYPYSLLGHTWSLGVEEQFYIIWPGVFFLFRRQLPKLARVLFLLIPCFWLYRATLHFCGVDEAYIYTAFETRVDAILTGCLLALVLRTGMVKALVERVRRTSSLVIVLALMTISQAIAFHSGVVYRNVVGFAIDPILVALLITQLVDLKAGAWMDSTPISYLGRISYSTYLYQEMVLPALLHRLPSKFAAVGCLLVTWIIAAISYELIEKPFLKLKRRFEAVRVEDAMGVPVTGEA